MTPDSRPRAGMPGAARTRSARQLGAGLLASLALVAAGCAADGDEEASDPAESASLEGCLAALDGVEVDADRDDVAAVRSEFERMTVLEVVAAIPLLDAIASTMQTMDDEPGFERPVTMFVPTQRREPPDTPGQVQEAPDTTDFSEVEFMRSHLIEDAALSLADLIDIGETEMAGGAPLAIDADEDGATLRAATTTSEVVCGDLPASDGVVHLIGEPLFDVERRERLDEGARTPAEQGVIPPERTEEFEDFEQSEIAP